jgi:hypothetical protein
MCSGFGLATVVLGFDRQGWITVFAALILALITLFTNYTHVDLLGAASVDLPQQAGIPCIVAAVAAAIAEAQLASNRRAESAAIRAGAEEAANEERGRASEERRRAARRAQQQAQCNLVQLRHQLEPSERNSRRVRDVISLLEEYGGMA